MRKDFFSNAHLVYLVRNKGKKMLLVKLVNRGLGSIVSYTKKIFILNCNLSNFCCMHFLLIRAFIYFHGKCILKHSLWGLLLPLISFDISFLMIFSFIPFASWIAFCNSYFKAYPLPARSIL